MAGEELFDVVNERDEVIGVAPRAQVHAEGLRHRAVHVLVFNPEGRLFVQRRSFAKDNSPGCWDTSAAGHLDAGEDYHAAALRELGEERVTKWAAYEAALAEQGLSRDPRGRG
jgi:isopentenyldiphosphate isomerase